ncbi:MAG: enoyl-ACP reductase [Candidatus Cloacimonetes bacterium]|nr:enoyl-ACP reductase [Candidatus Cloacimonadota bacterium]
MLQGKKGIIFGIANDKSIAWGCARSIKALGGEFGITYAGDIMEKRVRPLGEEIGAGFIENCDLTKEDDIARVMEKASQTYGKIDFLIHSVAYASKEALSNPDISSVSLEAFSEALTISAWTFIAMAKHAKPILNPGSSLVTMTYYGAQRAIQNYGLMGVAKAALEAEVRYLANEFGATDTRVNAISAGAIRTLAASGIKGFRDMQTIAAEKSAIKRAVTSEEVGDTAAFLVGPLSTGITGQILFVDMGYSANG